MDKKEKKFPNFIEDVKFSNIESNINSLNVWSEQIVLLLDQINVEDSMLKTNLSKCKDIIEEAKKVVEPNRLIDLYLKFGDIFSLILPDLKRKMGDFECLKKIAINYLDIAKQTKDKNIRDTAFAIADELSE